MQYVAVFILHNTTRYYHSRVVAEKCLTEKMYTEQK